MGMGVGRSFVNLGGGGGGNVFDVKIERSNVFQVNRMEDEKLGGGGAASSVASSSFKDRKVFEEEIESSPLGVAVLNRSVLPASPPHLPKIESDGVGRFAT